MNADLDEMFAALSRDGDAVPVSPAEGARRRGNRRSRNRSVAAALAVLLVIAGVSAAAWQRDHHRQPVLPATPDQPDTLIRGLNTLGDPLNLGADRIWRYPSSLEGRLFALSVPATASGSERRNRTVAIDERTGEILWSTPDELGNTDAPIPIPGSVLLPEETEKPTMRILDPATGAERWKLRFEPKDTLILHPDVLVRAAVTDGTTEGLDMRTGARLWVSPTSDRPTSTGGIRDRSGTPTLGTGFYRDSDGYMFQVLTSGNVLIRDVRTGDVVHRFENIQQRESELATVHDGTAIWPAGHQIWAAALGGGEPRALLELGADQRLEDLFGCGPGRICVAQASLTSPLQTRIDAVDIASAQTVWHATPSNGFISTSRGGRTLISGAAGPVLLDANGEEIFAAKDGVDWVDDGNLLLFERTPDGQEVALAAVSAVDGVRTPLRKLPGDSEVPDFGYDCGWSAAVLACAKGADLHRYAFTR
ncbi:PQQ-binding-like beta-propeller repeat protein [Actinoplanes sp. CA-015351]|uniref:outer membrane protein assembly factor BamB family protein n=1 Tax=Actinoplanes sp. CA-015351 TaxID=3239897 RepID=UPI003D953681